VDTHGTGLLEIAFNVVKACQAGFNMHDWVDSNIHHNLVINTTFPVIAVNASSVFITQCTFVDVIEQDTTRWTYQGFTMPRFQNAIGVFASSEHKSTILITNSIIVRAPTGLSISSSNSKIENGYINFDNVGTNMGAGVIQGNGILTVNSGFEDQINYRLSSSSPLRTAGNPVDGSPELGAYGGSQAVSPLGWNLP
jgi:hypothetical protein